LNALEGELSTLKPAFQSIVAQLESAQSQLTGAQSQLQSAQSALSVAQAKATATSFASPLSPLASVPMTSPLHTAVSAAGSAVSNAQGEIAALTSRGFRLLDEFESARGAAQGRVSTASHVPPHRSFWDSVFHDVGNWMSDTGHFLLGAGNFVLDVGKGIVDSVTGTWSAIDNFANHPSLATFGELAKDVAVDASIVVLAAAAPEALGLVSAEVAAEGAAGGAAEEGVSLAARLATVGKTAGAVSQDAAALKADADLFQGHYADYAVDFAFASIPTGENVADYFKVGDHAAEEAASTAENVSSYAEMTQQEGLTPVQALLTLSKADRASVFESVGMGNMDSPPAVDAAVQSTRASAAQAARTAARVGTPVAFAVEHIEDHTSEVTSGRLHDLLHPRAAASTACP
jgi:hypothetical protein